MTTRLQLDPVAVANHVVVYAAARHTPVTNLVLQRILYFVQAAFLVEHDTSLMDVSFHRWDYGPVAPAVYYLFKAHGVGSLTQPADVLETVHFTYATLDLADVDTDVVRQIEAYVAPLLTYKAIDLVHTVVKQDLFKQRRHDDYYTDDAIQMYFDAHPTDWLWVD